MNKEKDPSLLKDLKSLLKPLKQVWYYWVFKKIDTVFRTFSKRLYKEKPLEWFLNELFSL